MREKTSSIVEFLNDYENDMQSYTSHIFRANWQHEQMTACISKLKPNQVMMVMDFAKNYKCGFQNEVQSAYFDQNMVTIHPMMHYYKKNNKDGEEVLVKHAVIGISNDLKHDGQAVSVFEKKSYEMISKETQVDKIIQWTDGCAAQYKSKNCFYDISSKSVATTRNYFETSHGKNVCDGLGAKMCLL